MTSETYPRLSILKFGKILLESEDLDPIYVALYKLNLDHEQLSRWLVAYFCLYHAGVACYISEHRTNYWEILRAAVENTTVTHVGKRWPRGTERRHFRGESALKSIDQLQQRYSSPSDMIDYIIQPSIKQTRSLSTILDRVSEHHLFGSWIGFKIADMLERIVDVDIDFDLGHVFFFKEPMEAARLVYETRWHKEATDEVIAARVVKWMTSKFSKYQAPPGYERPIGVQEIETCLCKWKSHMGGHYPLYKDIREIRHGLEDWITISATARSFEAVFPKAPTQKNQLF